MKTPGRPVEIAEVRCPRCSAPLVGRRCVPCERLALALIAEIRAGKPIDAKAWMVACPRCGRQAIQYEDGELICLDCLIRARGRPRYDQPISFFKKMLAPPAAKPAPPEPEPPRRRKLQMRRADE